MSRRTLIVLCLTTSLLLASSSGSWASFRCFLDQFIPNFFDFLALFLALVVINSLTANSVLVGEKLVLFGKYLVNFYVGIVHYILCETKTQRAKIYLPTQCRNQ